MIHPDEFEAAVGNVKKGPQRAPQMQSPSPHATPQNQQQAAASPAPSVAPTPVQQPSINTKALGFIVAFICAAILLIYFLIHLEVQKKSPAQAQNSTTQVPTVTPTPTPTPVQPPSGDEIFLGNIPSLNAEVKSVRLFESGSAASNVNSRIYFDKFARQGTRLINWELNLTDTPPDHRIQFEIESVWSTTTGEIVERKNNQLYIDTGWTSASFNAGSGIDIPGQAWSSGKYKVELYAFGNLIARAPFEVIDDSEESHPEAFRGTISNLNIQAISLRFFESGLPITSMGERSYSDKFYKNTTRLILWELNLQNPAPDHRIPLEIIAVLKHAGQIVGQRLYSSYIDAGWSNSYQNDGWGTAAAGQFWTPGRYDVSLYVGGNLIANDSFDILDEIQSQTQQSSNYQRSSNQASNSETYRSYKSNPTDMTSNIAIATGEFVQIYRVEHRHNIGSCSGMLQLNRDSVLFFSKQHILQLNKTDVKHLDGSGITDHEGHNWHFKIKGKSDQYVRQLFENWYNNLEVDSSSPYTARVLQDLDCGTKAYPINYGKQTSIEFVNDMPEPRQIFAVGPNSELTLYKPLAPYEAS